MGSNKAMNSILKSNNIVVNCLVFEKKGTNEWINI